MPAIGSEFICDVSGHQTAMWTKEYDKRFHTTEHGENYYKYRFITGKEPKIGYFDKDNSKWIWTKLSLTQIKKGAIYHGVSSRGQFLTVAPSEDESVMIINIIDRLGSVIYKGKKFIQSYSNLAECIKL